MIITDAIHEKAVAIEGAAIGDPRNTNNYPATYWLALACSLLTSNLQADREQGKTMVRKWRKG